METLAEYLLEAVHDGTVAADADALWTQLDVLRAIDHIVYGRCGACALW